MEFIRHYKILWEENLTHLFENKAGGCLEAHKAFDSYRSRQGLLHSQVQQIGKPTKGPTRRPWFVEGNFLSIRKWELNFMPKNSTITHTTI